MEKLEPISLIKQNESKFLDLHEAVKKEGLLSDYVTLYPNRDYILQLDSAPSHASKVNQSYWLRQHHSSQN